MPERLATVQAKVSLEVPNKANAKLLKEYDAFMDNNRLSESRRKNNLKTMTYYGTWLAKNHPNLTFAKVNSREKHILPFLNRFRKAPEDDPEELWVTTWNDYKSRLVHFYRWLHNVRMPGRSYDEVPVRDWTTPEFMKFKKQLSKRKNTYSVAETWEREEVLAILPYEQEIRNKAIIAALWDLDGRNHELTRMKLKHIRFKETYAEGEIPFNTKTGGGPVLLRMSFPYMLEYMNKHPLRNDPEAPLFCNLKGGKTLGDELDPDYLWRILDNLKRRIKTLVEQDKVTGQEKEKLQELLNVKAWNPYCFRTSAIRHDATFLPAYALTQKVRWVPNSKQPGRYMAQTLSNEVRKQILAHDGIIDETTKPKLIHNVCPKCQLVNPQEYIRCKECSYPLTEEGHNQAKADEKVMKDKIAELEAKITKREHDIEEAVKRALAQLAKEGRYEPT